MLIDCHVHLNNYYTQDGHAARPTEENVQRLFRAMAEHGVDHAVVLTSYKVDVDRPSVEHVLEILAQDPRTTVVEGLRWRGESLGPFPHGGAHPGRTREGHQALSRL